MIAIDGDKQLIDRFQAEVAAVEEELWRQMGSQVQLVQRISRHTLEAGGKRLRPALVSLCAESTGNPCDVSRARVIGACMEMIHMATLIHDDVIDHAGTRRGRETASAIYGNAPAIMSGDVLLAKAMALLAADGDIEVIRTASRAVVEMAEGQVREMESRGQFDMTESEHLQVLRMKTASFIECCCEEGALIGGARESEREALKTYGHHLGMAFQIVDDLLDYRSEVTGKPKAGDFREGQATLPLIYLRETLGADESELARRKFGNGVTDDELRAIVGWMDVRGAFDRAEAVARKHLADATEALKVLPRSPVVDLLAQVGSFVLMRRS